ncbi:MAG: PhzF family phenazine biosynthesis protein [Deltaproteobacteria bacterium]|jgi:PhzF family phenazine biosynthesis protein|nr:PhzF family phenazine biosynthesis protein [Deltaproteobacteria bacterium]
MILKVFLVDAMVDGPFSGSPITVLYLSSPLEMFKMASLASEFGTAETVFILPHGEAFLLRFFTPAKEIKMGVHGCQAAAHIIYELGICPPTAEVSFLTQEGEVLIRHHMPDFTSMEMDTETREELNGDAKDSHAPLLSLDPKDVEWAIKTPGNDIILALSDYAVLKRLEPNLPAIMNSDFKAVSATVMAKQGADCDYCLRTFRPSREGAEEQSSGVINRSLAPHWAKLLQKKSLAVRQLSKRGGIMTIELPSSDKLIFKGRARTVLRADIVLENVATNPL